MHQWGIFPGTGGPQEQRETTLNVPLGPGLGDAEWLTAFSDRVAPAVLAFEPDALLVSAGFDAHEDEDLYLVDQRVTTAGFRELARRCAALAPRVRSSSKAGTTSPTGPAPRRGRAQRFRVLEPERPAPGSRPIRRMRYFATAPKECPGISNQILAPNPLRVIARAWGTDSPVGGESTRFRPENQNDRL